MMKIFIGTEPKTEIAYKVLAHSIRRFATGPVEITPMVGPGWEYPLDGIKVGTGFSLRRWMIPAACNWEGEALYLDADQLVFSDITKILDDATSDPTADPVVWTTYQPDKFQKTPWPQTSVMLIDCAKAKDHWGFHLDQVLFHLKKRTTQQDYANFMHCTWLGDLSHGPTPIGTLPVEWNSLNVYEKGKTKLLHYTSEPTQPWTTPSHPLAHLWEASLRETIEAGEITKDEFELSLSKWGVKEDWRPKNGMHPHYRKYLPLFG